MKIAVTGPRGFIAGNLIKYLEIHGFTVYKIDRDLHGNELNDWFLNVKPDAVVHLATKFLKNHQYSDISELIDSNIKFTTEILENAIQHDVKCFIGFGSYYQFPKAQSLYAATKNAQDMIFDYYANLCQLPIYELYLYDTYGSADHRDKILNLLIHAARSGVKLELSPGFQRVKFIHVNDVCRAVLHILKINSFALGATNRHSIEPTEFVTLRDLTKTIESIAGKKINAHWGAKAYAKTTVLEPSLPFPPLPNFTPQISLEVGLREVLGI